MSAEESDINSTIGNVITRSHAIEKLLRTHYQATGHGLYKIIDDLSDRLPAVLARTVRIIAKARNAAAHPEGFTAATIAPDFDRLCDEITQLIPYFASQRSAKPIAPAEASKPPQAPKPSPAKAPTNTEAGDRPANHAKPWTPDEEKKLIEGFDAQTPVPKLAKALGRGIGGVQSKLIKLGKLTVEQYQPQLQRRSMT